ncbi:hypothetical protein IMZ31_19000 (plasmid) [Pontibacillus sp. ALD_SL1]|uniref:hypothetical protein n=1 Tax=Pontibacillus sp. ALD_SL1 TaxID=2777185 RepID=UPI001A956A56|nr:hypothetical protein [Pontibacillus sp. ALD_SL1]QST02638.1 hypothetical protein IMZ31_19000 [Pontibacillus sp. ALD_SL1]
MKPISIDHGAYQIMKEKDVVTVWRNGVICSYETDKLVLCLVEEIERCQKETCDK